MFHERAHADRTINQGTEQRTRFAVDERRGERHPARSIRISDSRIRRIMQRHVAKRAVLFCAALSIAVGMLATPVVAMTVTAIPGGKTATPTSISDAAGGSVTVSISYKDTPLGKAPPPPPAATPTFTWNLYDADPFNTREANAIDLTQVNAVAPAGWVHWNATPRAMLHNCCYYYTFTAVAATGPLAATDPVPGQGNPDPFVEVIATLGVVTAEHDVCTPDLPAVPQGDLGVDQPNGSAAPLANTTGLADYRVSGFSRGYDEVSRLLSSETGTDTGIFFSSRAFDGTLPAAAGQIGPLVLFSAPPSGDVCFDEAASGTAGELAVSFFNMNIGDPGFDVATDEYYFVREDDYFVEYNPVGDIDETVIYWSLDDMTGRGISALAVEDNGSRGVFENGDYLVYAYEGSLEVWVLNGPQGDPFILQANGHTFDATLTLDFGHLAGEGTPGPFVTPTMSITSISIASDLAIIQPQPDDRVWSDYSPVALPAFFDDFETGSVNLFTDVVGSIFEFENDEMTLGGQREVHFHVSSTDGSGVFASTTNGAFVHDQSFDTFARSEVIWDGSDANVEVPGQGSLGLDLEADPSNAFVIEIERIENYSEETPLPSIGILVELDQPGRPRSEVLIPFTGPIVTDEFVVLPYQLFGPDLRNVAAVGLVVDGISTGDFVTRIASVTTTNVDTYPPIIDDFESSEVAISRSTVGSTFTFHRNPITLTGEMEIMGQVLASENIASLDVSVSDGLLTWSQGQLVFAVGSIVWDGMDGSASTDLSSAVNLTNQDAGALELSIDALSFDVGVTGGVGLSLGLVSRNNPGEIYYSPTYQMTSPITGGQTLVVPFADFMGEGSGVPTQLDLSEIASVTLAVDGGEQSSFDLSIGELRTVPMPVPEPGLAGSLIAGVTFMVALQRRRVPARA